MLITDRQHNALRGIAWKLLNPNVIIPEYGPLNEDDVRLHATMAQRYCLAIIDAHWLQILNHYGRSGKDVDTGDTALLAVLHGNEANPFYNLYKPALAAATFSWTSSWVAFRAMDRDGAGAENERRRLMMAAYEVLPLCVHLVYSGVRLAQPESHFDLSVRKAAEAQIAIASTVALP